MSKVNIKVILLSIFIITLPLLTIKLVTNGNIKYSDDKIKDCDIYNLNYKTELCLYNIIEKSIKQGKYQSLAKKLEVLQVENPYLATFCHTITHKLGHKAVDYYNSLEKMISDTSSSVCGEGMIHAAISRYVYNNNSSKDIFLKIGRLCLGLKDTMKIIGCGHGLGHAIAENVEIKKSMDICIEIDNKNSKKENIFLNTLLYNCSYGVIMQAYAPVDSSQPIKLYDTREVKKVCESIENSNNSYAYLGCSSAIGFGMTNRIINENIKKINVSKHNRYKLLTINDLEKEKVYEICKNLDEVINTDIYIVGYGCFGSIINEFMRFSVSEINDTDEKANKKLYEFYTNNCLEIYNLMPEIKRNSKEFCNELIVNRFGKEFYIENIESKLY